MPGTISDRSWNFRPLSGMFSTIVFVITWPTSDLVVCTSGASPVTTTVSERLPTFIVKSTVTEEATCTTMPLWTCVENPWISAVTSQVPTSIDSKW